MMSQYFSKAQQYIFPQRIFTRVVAKLADSQRVWLKNFLIETFIRVYKIDLEEVENPDLYSYHSFNEFFLRHLRKDCRPIFKDPQTVISPVDGFISQLGIVDNNRLMQAKGHYYSLYELLGGDLTQQQVFEGGQFITLYLSPRDYHRVHMPLTARIREMHYIPGKLFSVNQAATRHVPQLFARNERVICLFESANGPFALILVGAMLVGSMHINWHGTVTPPHNKARQSWQYQEDITLQRGDEMGHFKYGSTVIMLFPRGVAEFLPNLTLEQHLLMGQALLTMLQ